MASRPPHLRQSSGDPDGDGIPDRCSTCRHFQAGPGTSGSCRLYGGYRVNAAQVCDSYAVGPVRRGG